MQVKWLSVELLLRRDQLRKVILLHPQVEAVTYREQSCFWKCTIPLHTDSRDRY